MKIAVSGVGGAGKTTLCRLIAENTSLVLMPDIMDIWLWDRGYKTGKEFSEKNGKRGVIEWYLGSMEEKARKDSQEDNFISDKSVLDHGARWFARMFPEATQTDHNKVRDILQKGSAAYDKVIFLPFNPNYNVQDNNMRTIDDNHRFKVDLLLRGLADKYNVRLQHYDFKFSDQPQKVLADLGIA